MKRTNYWRLATIFLIPVIITLMIFTVTPMEKEMVDFPEFSIEKEYFTEMTEIMQGEELFGICHMPTNECVYFQSISS